MNPAQMASGKTENVFETALTRLWNDMANIWIDRGTGLISNTGILKLFFLLLRRKASSC